LEDGDGGRITQGLLHLRGSELAEAHLQVGLDNTGALAIYERLGYQRRQQTLFLALGIG
jgi:ribosomal protein S18 acetylase RimI-like enzyme